MNIPLDNLYHWIQGLAKHPVILYVFRPHGSKDIFDLDRFELQLFSFSLDLAIPIICHDQEPLDFKSREFNHDHDQLSRLLNNRNPWGRKRPQSCIDKDISFYQSDYESFPDFCLNWLKIITWENSNSQILLHSEKNSLDVEKFSQSGFVPVYYWSHAVIARDWYRFAEHDTRLQNKKKEKTFLVYCRDWTPLREYRLKFLDLLIDADLSNDCVISTQHVNHQGVHLRDYQVQDERFAVNTEKLLQIPDNMTSASSSADYDVDHINRTSISVILETVVDGNKVHLTEKILRAIACGHPFVLVAGPGALSYLRDYGFQTFNHIFDESYDNELDLIKRLEMVVSTMCEIQKLDQAQWREINRVAEQNRQRFFSEDFIKQVTDELQTNLSQAIDIAQDRGIFWEYRKYLRRTRKTQWLDKSDQSRSDIQELRRRRSTRFKNCASPVVGQ